MTNKERESKYARASVLAFFLCVIMITAGVLGIIGLQGSAGRNDRTVAGIVTDGTGAHLDDGIHTMPTAMTFAAPMGVEATEVSPTSVTLLATVTPDTFPISRNNVEWGTRFVNGDSAWATGKDVSDYISVRQSESNVLQATVTNSAPFGEQIEVYIKVSGFGTTVEDTCVCDYGVSITGLQFKTQMSSSPVKLTQDAEWTLDISDYQHFSGGAYLSDFQINYSSDVYTVAPSETVDDIIVYVIYSADYIEQAQPLIDQHGSVLAKFDDIFFLPPNFQVESNDLLMKPWYYGSESNLGNVKNKLIAAFNHNNILSFCSLKFCIRDHDDRLNQQFVFQKECGVRMHISSLKPYVSSVTLDAESHTFNG